MPKLNKIHIDEKNSNVKKTVLAQIYRSVEPILLMCRIMGLLPIIYIKKKGDIAFQLSDKDWMYFVLYFLGYLLLLMYNLKIVINEDITLYISKFFQLLFIIMLTFNMMTAIISGFVKRNIVSDGLKRIAEVDCFFKLADLKINYFAMRKKISKNLIIMLGLFLLRTVMFFLIPEIAFMQQVALIAIPLLKFIVLFEFSVFVVLISDRFEDINNAVRSCGRLKLATPEKVYAVTEKLYILCRSHFKLCNVAHMLNDAFGLQLLISVAMIILNFLAQYYFLYIVCTREVIVGAAVKIIAITIWFTGDVLELFGLLMACTDACDNANDIAIALHEIQNTVENTELESHIQIYSLQMLHQKINFSALGFFEIDFSLFYAIVGTVLTFLVIVVQYDQTQSSVKPTMDTQLFDNSSSSEMYY